MLWSLVKIILFVAIVAALALGAGYLLESSGGVQIQAGGTEYTLGPLQSVIGIVLLVLVVWLAIKLFGLAVATLRFLNGDETAMTRYFDRNRERKGFEALSDGLMALASGEGSLAMAKASKAERYLNRPDLTNLISAQAAEMAGDTKKAEVVYKRLLKDERTRFVGVRGIMKQKLADGDTDTALKLAEKAFALKPKHEDTQNVLLNLQAESEDWTGARETLGAKLKHGTLPRDVHRRRDAVLALSEAKDVMLSGSTIEAREAAIDANRLSPDLIPAAVMTAQGYIEQDKPKYAQRVLKKAWDMKPHPDLAATFAEIAPDETPQARIKRFKSLVKSQSDHAETKMLMAELQIANEDFPAARKALGDLIETDPSARSMTIMAAIERGEGAEDSVVRGWLTKALSASRGPQWVCNNCHNIHTQWAPVCGNCSSFDTFEWKTPPQGETVIPAATQMLPLIVDTSEAAETVGDDIEFLEVSPDTEEKITDAEIVKS